MHNDTLFLSIVNVVDYSMLVGFNEDTDEIVVGIIDYLRQYDAVKQIEHFGKKTILGQVGPTIVEPVEYRRRFRQAMEKYFVAVPDKWVANI